MRLSPPHLLAALLTLNLVAASDIKPLPTITPSPTLVERCDSPPCTYGGTSTTLTAATVTTTVLSTTSVPCYITTYVTNEQTTTSTVYSTETLTSTVTEQGTVTIIHYSPTPLLMSSTYESTLEITQTYTSYWQSVTGTDSETTITGSDTRTIGDTATGKPSPPAPSASWTTSTPSVTITYSFASQTPPSGTGSAWTHMGGGYLATSAATAVDAFNTGTTAGNQGSVNWNGSAPKVADTQARMIVLGAVVIVLIWEVMRFLT